MIFKLNIQKCSLGTHCEIALSRMPHNFTMVMRSQNWFKLWLVAMKQQAITWANVDPDLFGHMASLGHKELTYNF